MEQIEHQSIFLNIRVVKVIHCVISYNASILHIKWVTNIFCILIDQPCPRAIQKYLTAPRIPGLATLL